MFNITPIRATEVIITWRQYICMPPHLTTGISRYSPFSKSVQRSKAVCLPVDNCSASELRCLTSALVGTSAAGAAFSSLAILFVWRHRLTWPAGYGWIDSVWEVWDADVTLRLQLTLLLLPPLRWSQRKNSDPVLVNNSKSSNHVKLDVKYSERVQLPANVCPMVLLTWGHFGIYIHRVRRLWVGLIITMLVMHKM